MNGKRIAAISCCGAAVLLMLILPVAKASSLIGAMGVNTSSMSISGATCLSNGAMVILLPLFTGIAMAVCAALLDGRIGGGVCLAGMLVPLLAFQLLIKDLGVFGVAVQMGEGFILQMVLSLAAAILCFVDSYRPAAKHQRVGLSEDEDEW